MMTETIKKEEEEDSLNHEEEYPSQILGCSYVKDNSLPVDFPSNAEIPGEFYFETDHEALRSNPDYLALLKTLAVLQAQKRQAVRDSERLLEMKQKALEDPLAVVQRLQRGESWPDIPGKQVLAPMPDIQWEKYRIESALSLKKPETRLGSMTNSNSIRNTKESIDGLGCKVEKTSDGRLLVRGRLFDDRKPKTFNQPWTPEEQKRLEELLIEFPSEDVEMERWKKIARALGNRTPIQVQSRIQKYFLKLHKAGLPIPGRLTKSKIRFYKQRSHHNRRGVGTGTSHLPKNSTFFPDVNPVVRMNEDGDDTDIMYSMENNGSDNDNNNDDDDDVSDEEGVDDVTKSTSQYQELMWLKRIRKELELEQREGTISHLGFRCDGCNVEPIQGCRWHCRDCIDQDVDFCNDCAPKGIKIGGGLHKQDHKLKPIRKRTEGFVDRDYASPSVSYLDTNFMK